MILIHLLFLVSFIFLLSYLRRVYIIPGQQDLLLVFLLRALSFTFRDVTFFEYFLCMVKTGSTSVSMHMHTTVMFRMSFDIRFPYVLRNTCAQAQRRETVFCFLSHDLAVGPTHEFEQRSLNPPANAQVMKAITQEHDSSKRMMMTCPVTPHKRDKN